MIMSKTTPIFNSDPAEPQKASSPDMSFSSCGTGMCGTLTPAFKQEKFYNKNFYLNPNNDYE